ncbi:MAG: SH3 domain-containing protein [Flavobacteriaceae bacterium]|nr:SH3 domain-containing protein [Flavobacteriaceae bacterium]
MNKLLLILFISFSNFIYAQDCEYLGIDKEFENGDIAYLFGDNVRLRKAPSFEAEALAILKIGNCLEVLEKSNVKTTFKGIESPWYKVKYKNEVGYILGGLISLTRVKNNNLSCFIGLEKMDNKLYILTRVLSDAKTTYFENRSAFLGDNNGFCLKLFDNKGLQEISNIIYINYIPESGGANSGGYYLFFDTKKLHKVIELTSGNDIGIWESEQLYFPNDSLGVKGKIIYIIEEGEFSDSETEESEPDWEKSSKIKLKLKWVDNKLTPNPKTFENNQDGNW